MPDESVRVELLGIGPDGCCRTREVATGRQAPPPAGHAGHRIVTKAPDMAGRPVVICETCNVRL